MSKKFNKHLILNAVLGCGVPTGVINGLLAYYTGHEKNFVSAAIDMNLTLAAVAFILTVIMFPLYLKLAHTLPDPEVTRQDVPLLNALPTKTMSLALAMTFGVTLVFGIVPSILVGLTSPQVIGVTSFAVIKSIYTGIAAVPVNYIAVAMAKLVKQERQEVQA